MPQYQQVPSQTTVADADLLLFWNSALAVNRNIRFDDFFDQMVAKVNDGLSYQQAYDTYLAAIAATEGAEESALEAAQSATNAAQSASTAATAGATAGAAAAEPFAIRAEDAAVIAEAAAETAQEIAGITSPQDALSILSGPITGSPATPTMKPAAIVLASRPYLSEVIVQKPSDFDLSSIPFSIYRTRDGRFSPTISVDNYRITIPTTVLYVDVTSGSDSNGGSSWDDAFQGLSAAITSTEYTSNSGSCVINIAPGFYRDTLGINGQQMTRDTSLMGAGPGVWITGGIAGNQMAWSQQGSPNTNVYSTAIATFGTAVWDTSTRDSFGFFSRYLSASSVEDCQSKPGSFYFSNPNLYVHSRTGGEPTITDVIPRSTSSLVRHGQPSSLYCENVNFGFGASFGLAGGLNGKPVIFNGCSFAYMGSNGLSSVNRQGFVYLNNCKAYMNGLDGFNYDYTGTGYYVLEVDCYGSHNGYLANPSSSTNGSTAHADARVVRVNGTYLYNGNRNVHDISRSQSWNLGCIAAYTTAGGTGSYQSSNWVCGNASTPDETRMWLDSCISAGSVGSLNCYTGAILYIGRMEDYPKTGDGSFIEYTP